VKEVTVAPLPVTQKSLPWHVFSICNRGMPNVRQVSPNLMPPTSADLHNNNAEFLFQVLTESVMSQSGESRLRRLALLRHPAFSTAFGVYVEYLGINKAKVQGNPAMHSDNVLALEATCVQLPDEGVISSKCLAYKKQP